MSKAIEFVAAKTVGDSLTVWKKHKAQVKALKTKISDFDIKQRKTSTAVRKTTERISQRVAKAAARGTSAIAAESIPYVGIGVIVAVTTWELHDACETWSKALRFRGLVGFR